MLVLVKRVVEVIMTEENKEERTTTITISESTANRLIARKKLGDTYDSVINDMLDTADICEKKVNKGKG